MKTILSYVVAALLSGACTTFALAQGLSAQEKFDQLQAAGIFSGSTDGGQLEQNMNRAQFARVAALLLGLEQGAGPPQNPFTDIAAGDWYTVEVAATGQWSTPLDGAFNPNGDISLEQLARVVVQALGLDQTMDRDAQVEGASDWAQAYVAAAIQAGLIPVVADYTQPATRDSLVAASFTASTAILGTEVLDQDMVNPDDANPQSEVSNQDLAGMLGADTDQAGGEGDQNASVPDEDDPSQANDNLAFNDQIANEVLIGQLVEESVALAATGSMYPYFDAGWVMRDLDVINDLNATYTGRAGGTFADGSAVGGALTMSVDFASSGPSGLVYADILFDNSMGQANFELNQNVGDLVTSSVTGAYGDSFNMESITAGHLTGNFYGPGAEEVGGTWGITAGSHGSADGTFNGKR